jgi:hypothetical protein
MRHQRSVTVSGRATLRRLALTILEALGETEHDGKEGTQENE